MEIIVSLTLHLHPLSSFCWKALIGFYENGTDFEATIIDFSDPASVEAFGKLWPIKRMPVLWDSALERAVPEASIILEHISLHYPGKARLIPVHPDVALQARLADRFYDHYVHVPMQKIVTDKLRPEGRGDPHGVEDARKLIRTSYDLIERTMANREFAAADHFSLGDCAASPALWYADKVEPIGERPATRAYLDRLIARPAFQRVLAEAEPYFKLFPG